MGNHRKTPVTWLFLGSLQIPLQPARMFSSLVTIQIAPRTAGAPLHGCTGIDALGHIAREKVAKVVGGVIHSAEAQEVFR